MCGANSWQLLSDAGVKKIQDRPLEMKMLHLKAVSPDFFSCEINRVLPVTYL